MIVILKEWVSLLDLIRHLVLGLDVEARVPQEDTLAITGIGAAKAEVLVLEGDTLVIIGIGAAKAEALQEDILVITGEAEVEALVLQGGTLVITGIGAAKVEALGIGVAQAPGAEAPVL